MLRKYMRASSDRREKIIRVYSKLLKEFIAKRDEMIKKLGSDPTDLKYIVSSGAGAMCHVFNFALASSNEVDIAAKLARKAVYYYLEFISQIGEDDHQYLKLTPRDAVLFVYKKTIDDLCAGNGNQPVCDEDRSATMCTEMLTQAVSVLRDSNKIDILINELAGILIALSPNINGSDVMWVCSFMSQIEDTAEVDTNFLLALVKKVLTGGVPKLSTAQAAQSIACPKEGDENCKPGSASTRFYT